MASYLNVLHEALRAKQKVNPRFSIRAYARALGVNPGSLTQILQGRRFFSAKLARRMFPYLALDEAAQAEFLRSLAEAKKNSGMRRIDRGLRDYLAARKPPEPITDDLFRAIADWHHYALLELATIDGFSPDPAWIAERLGIPEKDASESLERLIRLDLLVPDASGRIRRRHDRMVTADPSVTTAAHRRRQAQLLEKSARSLDTVPLELRNHSAMTLAIDPARLPAAKQLLARFMNELTDFLDVGRKSCVYEISFQVFPLQTIQGAPRETTP